MRPSTIDAVLFDFDGTLADTEPLGMELDREALAALGVEVPIEELHALAGTDGTSSVRALLDRHGRPDIALDEYYAHRRPSHVIYRDMVLKVFPGALELVASLRGRGTALALVSTTNAAEILYALDRLGAASLFDAIVTGDMVDRHKPEPDPYLLALSMLGVDPSRAVVVEDSRPGIASAKAAGLYTVAFKGSVIEQDTSAADEEVHAYADLVL